jgi:hypothetical protein
VSTSSYSFDPGARRGDTFVRTLTYSTDAVPPVGIDLTGASVEWGLAPVPDGSPKLQFVDDGSAAITNAAAGVITLTLSDVQTLALKARAYAFEVTLIYANGTRETILDGFLPVDQKVVEVTP